MTHIPLPELGESFRSLERPGRRAIMTALVECFQPSDYRDMASICFPQLYVGDLVQILPSEVADLIFAYCEPQDIFKFRNVSTIWNNYLTQPEFLQRMDHKMYANGGQYLLDSDLIDSKRRSFEECVRHRCALLNGRACKFEHILNAKDMGDAIQFNSGTLIEWTSETNYIYVNQLYRDEPGWKILRGDEEDEFCEVRLTPRHILACTASGQVYCWELSTLEVIANFWLDDTDMPNQDDIAFSPDFLDASSDTIVVLCEDVWFLYSLEKETLTRVDTYSHGRPNLYAFQMHAEQSGYFYICESEGDVANIDVLKIDGSSSTISFVRRIDLYALGRQQVKAGWDDGMVGSSRDTFQVVVVWQHRHMCSTRIDYIRKDVHELIFEMKDGIVTYHHTIQHQEDRPRPSLYHPQMHLAFTFNYDAKLDMPLGLYQINDETYRPVHLGQGKFRSLHDIDTVSRADLTDEDFDDIKWSVHANKQYTSFSGGDGNFAIWTLGRFTKVWRFYGIDENLFTTENTSSS